MARDSQVQEFPDEDISSPLLGLVAHPVGLGATFLFICGECWNGLAKNDMSTFHNH